MDEDEGRESLILTTIFINIHVFQGSNMTMYYKCNSDSQSFFLSAREMREPADCQKKDKEEEI